ncbi:TPA: hypothetical protein ACYSD8_003275 [Citrobacter freundii]|uniref:hypothetical protein n=1 Tax=Citrobacter freundii TaxID=546 RepID=UPI003D69CEBC
MAHELLKRRKPGNDEPIYQCEFCHHDGNGDLQWHWEDVNKDFYDQYDSGRRGQRRVLYTRPQPAPVVPDEKPMPNPLKMYAVDAVAAIAEIRGWNACRAAMLQGEPQNAQQNIPKNIPAGNSPIIGIDLASGPDHTVEVRYFSLPGYSVVPIAPTQEMVVAGGDTYVRSEEVNQYPTDAARRIWAAMVAAATMQEVKKTPVAKEIAMGARLTDHRFKI